MPPTLAPTLAHLSEQNAEIRKERRRRYREKRRERKNETQSQSQSQANGSRSQSEQPEAGPSVRVFSKSLADITFPPAAPRRESTRNGSGSRKEGNSTRNGDSQNQTQNQAQNQTQIRSTESPTSAPHITPNGVPHAGDFAEGDDFIAFDASDHEHDDKAEADRPAMAGPSFIPDRKGKGRERSPPSEIHTGEKRSRDQMEQTDDGYVNKKQRVDAASRLTPWVEDVDWDSCRNMAEMLHKEVKAFVNYLSPTPEEHAVRGMVIEMITRAVQTSWPDAQISAFGSYETKLYLPLGDIDLVIQSRVMESYDKRRVLYNLAQVLRKNNITNNVQVIAKAKVPIIKFVTNFGRFSVDICLNQTNGILAGEVVNRLLKQLPPLRSLVMMIKLFLNQRSMNEVYTGGLGSYAIVCMAVSFFQMHPKIRAGEINPAENLGVLAMEFFELYGHHFNYEHTGISLQDGGTYFSKIARGWDDPKNPSLLSIEDPLDSSNDISKNSYNMFRVRKTLAGAHEVLTAAAFMRCRILMAKANGEYVNLRSNREYDNPSILGSVLGVTRETLNHRKMVKQLYYDGILHQMLGLPRQPLPPVFSPPPLPPAQNSLIGLSRSQEAVESAWEVADMDYSDNDSPAHHHSSSDPEEESRYAAHNGPRKRRRLNGTSNANGNHDTLYIPDSEDSDEPQIALHIQDVPSREGPSKRPVDPEKLEARRAYWASKGMSGGGLEDSE
ncbi:hypothetical protein M422DRAFT_30412 [Sphaerobolus stellatus SS14]|uniref:polynucleotide adenylyltransferase n=1 Tax=Sphaerobolus stellatus (strain SS14) TaxID=990650 RepID=A0A0C9VPV9_SPHS4|nr:hypothetical protein M422DRAFT_30412 [Sphaerobolus stellatus SS14]